MTEAAREVLTKAYDDDSKELAQTDELIEGLRNDLYNAVLRRTQLRLRVSELSIALSRYPFDTQAAQAPAMRQEPVTKPKRWETGISITAADVRNSGGKLPAWRGELVPTMRPPLDHDLSEQRFEAAESMFGNLRFDTGADAEKFGGIGITAADPAQPVGKPLATQHAQEFKDRRQLAGETERIELVGGVPETDMRTAQELKTSAIAPDPRHNARAIAAEIATAAFLKGRSHGVHGHTPRPPGALSRLLTGIRKAWAGSPPPVDPARVGEVIRTATGWHVLQADGSTLPYRDAGK